MNQRRTTSAQRRAWRRQVKAHSIWPEVWGLAEKRYGGAITRKWRKILARQGFVSTTHWHHMGSGLRNKQIQEMVHCLTARAGQPSTARASSKDAKPSAA